MLNPRSRTERLYKFPELENILQQYEQATMSDAVSHEIQNEARRQLAGFGNTKLQLGGRVDLEQIFSLTSLGPERMLITTTLYLPWQSILLREIK